MKYYIEYMTRNENFYRVLRDGRCIKYFETFDDALKELNEIMEDKMTEYARIVNRKGHILWEMTR